jgi:hypothetical protein
LLIFIYIDKKKLCKYKMNELEKFTTVGSAYANNLSSMKNVADNLDAEVFRKFAAKHGEILQRGIEAGAILQSGKAAFKGVKNLLNGTKPSAVSAEDNAGSGSALEEAGFTEDDLEGSDMFDDVPQETEMKTFSSNVVEDSGGAGTETTDVDDVREPNVEMDDRGSMADADPIDADVSDEVQSGLTEGLQDASDAVSDGLSAVSEGVSAGVTAGIESGLAVADAAQGFLDPISDILTAAVGLYSLFDSIGTSAPAAVIQQTASLKGLTVSQNYDSVLSAPSSAIF